jgi:opacity protein-like surface antigen
MVMKKILFLLMFVIGSTCLSQEAWSVTFRPSLHIPTVNVFNRPLRIGNGLDLTAGYRWTDPFQLYTGFTYNLFDNEENAEEQIMELRQFGVLLGGRYFFKISPHQNNPFYLSAGLLFSSITSKSNDALFNFDSDASVGSQLGIGWELELTENWFFLPELRFSSLSNDYIIDGVSGTIALKYLSITAALMHTF